MDNANNQPLAVVFGTQGGLSDVGKFAATQAVKKLGTSARIIVLAPTIEDPNREIDADITDETLLSELKADFANMTLTRIDIDAEDAQDKLNEATQGVGTVLACLASRQPSFSRWLEKGAKMVRMSMEKNNANRLVILSSFGIGQDFTPLSPLKVMWRGMLHTSHRAPWKDLIALEAVVESSDLDYLIVRPAGLTPSEPPRGKWKLLTAPKSGGVGINIAKKDVAEFMLNEATAPTFHRTAVTIGGETK